MLRLFNIQRRTRAVLLRSCLQAVASQNLYISRKNPSGCRRNMSANPDVSQGILPSTGHYNIWSLISNPGDSLMRTSDLDFHGELDRPGIDFSGSYGHSITTINVINSTVLPQPTISFILTSDDDSRYYLSVIQRKQDYMITTKPVEEINIGDTERFIRHRHGSYSMFESKAHRGIFLGCNRDGSSQLFHIHDITHPDTRVLLLMHLKTSMTLKP